MTKQVLVPPPVDHHSRPQSWCPLFNRATQASKPSVQSLSLSQGWQIDWSSDLDAIAPQWDRLPGGKNLFLTSAYFRLVRRLKISSLEQHYAIFRHESGQQFGIVLEHLRFNAEQQLKPVEQVAAPTLWQRFVAYLRVMITKLFRFNILTAGQMLLTGQHALRGDFPEDAVACHQILTEGVQAIAKQLPVRIHGVMLKDLPIGDAPGENGYHELPVQPNMILHLRPEWEKTQDYLDAMSSKYRVRAKRARKKAVAIERREMGLDEITTRQAEMHTFYQGIAQQADYNVAILPADYFTQWKTHFPHRFRVWGYFLDGEFIGFTTTISNGPELEAHFLGFDQSFNRSHQLYLNMLYDMAEEAIEGRYEQLVYSRTAMEIKSSVGAVPEKLRCWGYANVRIADPFVSFFAKVIAPLPDWVQRKPFK